MSAGEWSGLVDRLEEACNRLTAAHKDTLIALSAATERANAAEAALTSSEEQRDAARELVTLLQEMVDLLTEAERASLAFLHVHGWYTDPALVDRGAEIRAALNANAAATEALKEGDDG